MQTFQYQNLVYIPITKNASTSYSMLFGDVLGWANIDSVDIDWNSAIVFSHIMDPVRRHVNGIAECLQKYKLTNLLEQPNFDVLLGTAVFDIHSYPIYASFNGDRERIMKVRWIPIDHPDYCGKQLTVDFLKNFNVTISKDDIPELNKSTPEEKSFREKIQQVRDKNNLTEILSYFYGQDIKLHNAVLIEVSVENGIPFRYIADGNLK